MHGRIRIAVILVLAGALVFGLACAYVAATSSDAQTAQPRSITSPSVRGQASGGGAGIAAAGDFVYVVDEGKVYKLNAETLKVVAYTSYKSAEKPAESGGSPSPVRSITQPPPSGGGGTEK